MDIRNIPIKVESHNPYSIMTPVLENENIFKLEENQKIKIFVNINDCLLPTGLENVSYAEASIIPFDSVVNLDFKRFVVLPITLYCVSCDTDFALSFQKNDKSESSCFVTCIISRDEFGITLFAERPVIGNLFLILINFDKEKEDDV